MMINKVRVAATGVVLALALGASLGGGSRMARADEPLPQPMGTTTTNYYPPTCTASPPPTGPTAPSTQSALDPEVTPLAIICPTGYSYNSTRNCCEPPGLPRWPAH